MRPHKFFTPSSASEAVAWRCSVKKVFLEILQNSQENTCARVSFLIKLQVSGCNFISLQLYWKKRLWLWPGVFLWVLRNFKEHLFLHNTFGGCFWVVFKLNWLHAFLLIKVIWEPLSNSICKFFAFLVSQESTCDRPVSNNTEETW